MTAPLRAGEPINVNVGLGGRAYDIAIGRGLLATLGERRQTAIVAVACTLLGVVIVQWVQWQWVS